MDLAVDTIHAVAYHAARSHGYCVRNGAIAQLGERLHGMQEVSGSIPLSSTTSRGLDFLKYHPHMICGAIAQLGERLHGMQEVSGSIPLSSTNSLFYLYYSLNSLSITTTLLSKCPRYPKAVSIIPDFQTNSASSLWA